MIYTYDDHITASEIFGLLERMMAFKGDHFPAKNVFHFELRSLEKEEESLRNTISITAKDDAGTLIGYVRVLTDAVYIYYILDVMVDPDYRKKGIGKRLLQMAVDEAKKNGFIKLFLTAIPSTEKFYEQFGFKEGMSPVLTLRGEDFR